MCFLLLFLARARPLSLRLCSASSSSFLLLSGCRYVLRCIDKVGGLDNYLLHPKRKDKDSVVGQRLKELVLERLAQIEEEDAAAEAAGQVLEFEDDDDGVEDSSGADARLAQRAEA